MRNTSRSLLGLSITIAGLSLTSCAWWINNTEALHYDLAIMHLQEIVEEKNIASDCDYNFNIERPEIFASAMLNSNGDIGEYNTRSKTINYLSGEMTAIHHEAFHHISRNGNNGPQTYYCLEQTAGSLLSRIVELEFRLRK